MSVAKGPGYAVVTFIPAMSKVHCHRDCHSDRSQVVHSPCIFTAGSNLRIFQAQPWPHEACIYSFALGYCGVCTKGSRNFRGVAEHTSKINNIEYRDGAREAEVLPDLRENLSHGTFRINPNPIPRCTLSNSRRRLEIGESVNYFRHTHSCMQIQQSQGWLRTKKKLASLPLNRSGKSEFPGKQAPKCQ